MVATRARRWSVTHVVNVSVGSKYQFLPWNVTATAGDVVRFQFGPGANHSVVEAKGPDSPCVARDGGFRSPHFDLTRYTGPVLKYEYSVVSNDSVYFYCAVADHCHKAMVGGINVNTEDLGLYSSAAVQLQPPLPVQPELEHRRLVSTAATPTATSRSSSGSSNSGLGSGATAAIVLGILALFFLLLCMRFRRRREPPSPPLRPIASPVRAPERPRVRRGRPVNRQTTADSQLPSYNDAHHDALHVPETAVLLPPDAASSSSYELTALPPAYIPSPRHSASPSLSDVPPVPVPAHVPAQVVRASAPGDAPPQYEPETRHT